MTNQEPRLRKMPKTPLQIVCCLIFDSEGRVLLLQRHRDDLGGGLWATPGGKQEPDEDSSNTAVREIFEETGIKLEEPSYLGAHEMRMPHGVAHMKTYRGDMPDGGTVTISAEEHEAFQWFDLNDLLGSSDIIWGLPTTLADFGIIDSLDSDPTLGDGSEAVLMELGESA